MAKLAVVDLAQSVVLDVFVRPEGADEVTIQYVFPGGTSIAPVKIGWANNHYAVMDVTEFVVPEGKKAVGELSYAPDNGVVIETCQVEDIPVIVPDRVTARQFKLQLLAMPAIGAGETLLDDVEAWVATQDRSLQVAYGCSGTFVREEPMMQAGFTAMGFTAEQIDDFFIAASQI